MIISGPSQEGCAELDRHCTDLFEYAGSTGCTAGRTNETLTWADKARAFSVDFFCLASVSLPSRMLQSWQSHFSFCGSSNATQCVQELILHYEILCYFGSTFRRHGALLNSRGAKHPLHLDATISCRMNACMRPFFMHKLKCQSRAEQSRAARGKCSWKKLACTSDSIFFIFSQDMGRSKQSQGKRNGDFCSG